VSASCLLRALVVPVRCAPLLARASARCRRLRLVRFVVVARSEVRAALLDAPSPAAEEDEDPLAPALPTAALDPDDPDQLDDPDPPLTLAERGPEPEPADVCRAEGGDLRPERGFLVVFLPGRAEVVGSCWNGSAYCSSPALCAAAWATGVAATPKIATSSAVATTTSPRCSRCLRQEHDRLGTGVWPVSDSAWQGGGVVSPGGTKLFVAHGRASGERLESDGAVFATTFPPSSLLHGLVGRWR